MPRTAHKPAPDAVARHIETVPWTDIRSAATTTSKVKKAGSAAASQGKPGASRTGQAAKEVTKQVAVKGAKTLANSVVPGSGTVGGWLLGTRTGRKVTAGIVAFVMAVGLAIPVAMIQMVTLVVGGEQRQAQQGVVVGTKQGNISLASLDSFDQAMSQSGVAWEVPAVLTYYETGAGAGYGPASGMCSNTTVATPGSQSAPLGCPAMPPTKGGTAPSWPTATTCRTVGRQQVCRPIVYIGPLQIRRAALTPAQQTQATNLTWAATWVSDYIATAIKKQPGWYDGLALDTGVIYNTDGAPPTISTSSAGAKTVKSAYEAAIAGLPIKNMDSTFAANAFELAQGWYVVYAPRSSAYTGTLGMVCGVKSGTTLSVPTPNGGFMSVNAQQLSNAAVTVNVAKSLGVPQQGMVVAIMVELAESTLTNLPNSTVPGSENDPNVQWGGYSPSNPPHNGSSVGPFQQQTNWWPNVATGMTLDYSAAAFFGKPPNFPNHPQGLLQVPNWQSLPPGVAAQDVQGSANPSAYAPWQAAADKIVGATLGIKCSGATGVSVAGDSPQAKKVILAAEQWVGKAPYVWGGGTPAGPSGSATAPAGQVGQPGFDCSGLVLWAFSKVGVTLPHFSGIGGQYSVVQAAGGLTTQMSQLKPGDLVFFAGSDGTVANPGHVGIYVGNNQMINATTTGQDVQISNIGPGSGWTGFVGGGPV